MRRRGIRLVLGLAIALASSVAACAVTPPLAFDVNPPNIRDRGQLVVVGDLQRTAPILEFWREQNDPERERVVHAIAEAHPDLLAITGDCVFDGGSTHQWAAFDALTAPLRSMRMPAVAAFGNHEYWGGRAAAEENLFARFPLDARRHAFVFAFGPLRLVFLDSNRSEMTSAEWARQVEWYGNTLATRDQDPTVRGVLVLLHHAPYSNSTVTDDDTDVQHDFVPPFLRAHKSMAMLTGHVHNRERFVREGRHFIVSGGGGGPRAALATGTDRRHPDDLVEGPPLREFHFTVYTLTDHGIDAEVRGFGKDETHVRTLERFAMPWP